MTLRDQQIRAQQRRRIAWGVMVVFAGLMGAITAWTLGQIGRHLSQGQTGQPLVAVSTDVITQEPPTPQRQISLHVEAPEPPEPPESPEPPEPKAPEADASPHKERVPVSGTSDAVWGISSQDPTFNGRPIRPARTMRMLVTAYSPDERSCGKWADGITASGRSVWTNGMKLVAADTRLLPFGSIVSIPGYNGGKPVPVLDRGGKIKGHRLDVLYPTHEIARRWGVQRLEVIIWEYAD